MDRLAGPPLAAAARAFVEEHRERLVSLCADLVAANSAQPEGATGEAAEVLSRFLAEHGVASEQRASTPEKPNLVARLGDPGSCRHLVLNGHLDTLPAADPAAWTVPMFELGRAHGRLTGLGTGNMKAGTAALALAFVFLARNRMAWQGRVTYTAVADEVVFGPDGAGWLLDSDPDLVGTAVINGEGPGDMGLALAEKGLLWLEIVAEAPAGQGMLSRTGSSAIARLGGALVELDGWNDRRVAPPPDLGDLDPEAAGQGLRLSVNVGTVRGGHFVSQVASRAVAEVDFRVPPGLTIEAVEAEVDALLSRRPGLSWRRIKGWNPNWSPSGASIVRHMADAALAVRGAPAPRVVRLPASDAARWRRRGVEAVCFGPQPTLASGPDDYVKEQDVLDCAAIYAVAAIAYLSGEM